MRVRRLRQALTPAQWRAVAAMAMVVGGLHVLGFGVLLVLIAPRHYTLGSAGVFGVGLGITAYLLGCGTRSTPTTSPPSTTPPASWWATGQRPMSRGFWFSLGHSSRRVRAGFLLAIGVRAMIGPVRTTARRCCRRSDWSGHASSGTFLILIGLLNLFVAGRASPGLPRGCAPATSTRPN